MHFILSNYGEKYFGYVLVCIYSIQKSNPNAIIHLFWQDMDSDKITAFKNFFSNVNFIQTNFNFSKDEAKRISSKTIVLDYAIKKLPLEENTQICIIDADTMVLKDISVFFTDSFDLGITDDRKRTTPLNTGVLFARYSKNTIYIFETWKNETFKIFDCKEKTKVSLQRPYSGVDQMSMWEMIDYSNRIESVSSINIAGEVVCIKRFDCKVANHIYNGEIAKDTMILHFKGVWNDLLIYGAVPSPLNFTKYKIFGQIFHEALNALNLKLQTRYTQNYFNIRLHTVYLSGRLNIWNPSYHLTRNAFKLKNSILKKWRKLRGFA